MEPETMRILRRMFHQMNRGMVLLWRIGLGRFMNVWPRGFGRLLVIEHRGRRTGARYLTPVNYTPAGDDLYCIAAFGASSDWYRNLLAASHGAAWLPDGRWEIRATDASDDRQRLQLLRSVLIDSGFAAPLFGLHPHRMDDAALAEATADYRLVRLRTTRRAATENGPGDLAWVWIPIGITAALLLRRRRVH
jgi:deazaflavin-dependent oxidoreductase (nitroreductase family)